MKNLLYKEFKLATHPTTYLFLALCTMMLIPNYPGYVPFMYVCLSIFFVFLGGRENKDIYYTALLPIRKRDIVKARFLMIAITELVQIALAAPMAVLANRIYHGAGNLAGIDLNVALFGSVFVFFAVFNITFLPIFYRSAYKVGTALLYGGAAILIYYLAAEMLVWVPSPVSTFLDTLNPAMMMRQLPILLAGMLIWAAITILAYHRAAANFEKVDL
jgi:hypothetical protein